MKYLYEVVLATVIVVLYGCAIVKSQPDRPYIQPSASSKAASKHHTLLERYKIVSITSTVPINKCIYDFSEAFIEVPTLRDTGGVRVLNGRKLLVLKQSYPWMKLMTREHCESTLEPFTYDYDGKKSMWHDVTHYRNPRANSIIHLLDESHVDMSLDTILVPFQNWRYGNIFVTLVKE